jgi:O-acetyl-ADP-ribose deacetylase (regulator of RNase III)
MLGSLNIKYSKKGEKMTSNLGLNSGVNNSLNPYPSQPQGMTNPIPSIISEGKNGNEIVKNEAIGLRSSNMSFEEAITFIKKTHEEVTNKVEVIEEKQEKLDEIQIEKYQELKLKLEIARDIVFKMPADPEDLQLKVNIAITYVRNKLADLGVLDDLKPIAKNETKNEIKSKSKKSSQKSCGSLVEKAKVASQGKLSGNQVVTVPTDKVIGFTKAMYICPPFNDPSQSGVKALEQCYANIFAQAYKEKAKSIYLPTFSTNVKAGGFSHEIAASTALFQALQFITTYADSNLEINFVIYSAKDGSFTDHDNGDAYEDQFGMYLDQQPLAVKERIKFLQDEIQTLEGDLIVIPVDKDFKFLGKVAEAVEKQILLNDTVQPSGKFFRDFIKSIVLDFTGENSEVPSLEWDKLDPDLFLDPHWEENFLQFQEDLKFMVIDMLTCLGLKVNNKGFYKGLEIAKFHEIDQSKKIIKAQLLKHEGQFTALMTLLSRAGMADYADQIRTSFAGQLGIKGTDVEGSVKFDYVPNHSKAYEIHEDHWTKAIRDGHGHYMKCFPKRTQIELASAGNSFRLTEFDQWDHQKVYNNSELHQLIELKVSGKYKESWPNFSMPDCALPIKQMTFLNPKEGRKYCKECSLKFPEGAKSYSEAYQQAFDIRLNVLGKKTQYYDNKKAAEKFAYHFLRLTHSFGSGKIDPRSIEVATEHCGKNINEIIAELQNANVIGPQLDSDGYYPLAPGAKNYHHECKSGALLQTLEGRIKAVLDLAQGVIGNRYDARRMAPTFYQGQTSNENFDIPRHKLPFLLQYEDLRIQVVEETKKICMALFGVTYDPSSKQFQIVDQHKFDFINDTDNTSGIPAGPSVVSVFLDSMASLGEQEWATAFKTFLVSKVGADLFWENAVNNMSKEFDKTMSFESISKTNQTPMTPITPIQEAGYQNRRNRVPKLHEEGLLHVRVFGADHQELLGGTGAYSGQWPLNRGPNLSTTVLPSASSKIDMILFCDGARAVAIDPFTVTPEYFGNGFEHNGCTQMDNFQNTLKNRADGYPLEFIRDALAKESAQVDVGQREASRSHTEIAYFRAAERNLVTGLLFKVNDENYAGNLRALIELQNTLRQDYGLFLPLFAYKDRHFQEVVVDSETLRALGMSQNEIAVRVLSPKEKARKEKRPKDYFNLYGGLDTQMVIAAKDQMTCLPLTKSADEEHKTNFKKLFDLQLMLLQMKGPKDQISFSLPDSNGVEKLIDLSVIDNLHLVFPTVFPTGNQGAKAQNLFFSHTLFTRFLRDTPSYHEFWLQMAKRNMKVFLGIDLQSTHEGALTSIKISDTYLPHFADDLDPTGKTQYAKCISRLIQMLLILDKKDWADAIILDLRKKLGDDFGKQDATDFFTNSDEIIKIEGYLHKLKDRQYEQVDVLPSPYGAHEVGEVIDAQPFRGRFVSAEPVDNANNVNLPNSNNTITVQTRFPNQGVSRFPNQGVSRFPNQEQVVDENVLKFKKALIDLRNKIWGDNIDEDFKNLSRIRDKVAQLINIFNRDNTYCEELIPALVGAEFDALQAENAYDNTKANAESVKVFYNKKLRLNQISDMLTKTAIRTTNGDLDLLLPDGSNAISPNQAKSFLTDTERRLKRAYMVLAGRMTVTAKGGYNSKREKLAKKTEVIFINSAAPQFEKCGMPSGELEVSDFIVKTGAQENGNPLFKEYYSDGKIPSHKSLDELWVTTHNKLAIAKAQGSKASLESLRQQGVLILHEDDPRSLEADLIRLRNGDFFLVSSFKKSMDLYVGDLLLPAVNQMTAKDRKNYFKATAFGAGFFASLGLEKSFQTSLKKYVVDSLVKTYTTLLESKSFEKGDVIEFPYYDLEYVPQALKLAADKAGVELIWRKNRDILDFTAIRSVNNTLIDPELFNRVVFNAGDAFSFVGNEASSKSLEAMLANDSDMRFVFNWLFNPHLFNEKNYVKIA